MNKEDKWAQYEDKSPEDKWDQYVDRSEPQLDMRSLEQEQPIDRLQALGYGFRKGLEDITHGVHQPLSESGALGEGWKQSSLNMSRERNENYDRAEKRYPGTAKTGAFLGDTAALLPAYAVAGLLGGPSGVAEVGAASKVPGYLKYLTGILKGARKGATAGAAWGGGTGLARYTPNGESRVENALTGAEGGALFGGALGAGVPGVLSPVGSGIKTVGGPVVNYLAKAFGNKKAIASELFEGLSPSEVKSMRATKSAAHKMGVHLTPAEASGNPILAKAESNLGATTETQRGLHQYKKGQKGAQKKSIDNFLEGVSGSENVASQDIRQAASDAISKKRSALVKEATPYYEQSYKDNISNNKLYSILKDSNIEQSYNNVLRDPLYRTELEGFSANSVKILDQVKKNLDSKIHQAMHSGDREGARILKGSREKLVTALDEVSPSYRQARKIYTEGMPAIKALEKGVIGRIAKLSDDKLKNVSKQVFDPQQTDIKSFNKVRDILQQENPKAWDTLIRNEMERRMSSVKGLNASENYGSAFYDAILSKDKDFNQFYRALGKGTSSITPNQHKLIEMRKAYRGLINNRPVKSAGGEADVKFSLTGNLSGAASRLIKDNLLSGKYDKAAIEIITDPNWENHIPEKLLKGNRNLDKPKAYDMIEILAAMYASQKSTADSKKQGAKE